MSRTPDAAERPLLLTLGLLTTVTAVVSSLGAPLVPVIAERFDVTIASAQWALTSLLLAGAVTTPILGRLASGRLRRPTVIAGTAVVLGGTVLSALPFGFVTLVLGRTLQGVGLGLVPLALAIARDHTQGRPEQMARWLGLLSVTTVAGAGLGYPITSLVAEHAGLAGAYWFGSALLAITLVMAVRHVPSAEAAARPVDVVGALLLALGMLGFLLAVSQGEHWGWTTGRTLGLGGAGVVLLAAWVAWTLTRRDPLVDLHLAGRPGVGVPNAVTFLIGMSMYALLTLVVVLVQADGDAGYGLDLGVAATGLILVPYAVMSVGGNQAAQRVARRFGPHAVLPVGCTAFASSLVVLAVWHDSLAHVLVAMALGGLGSGFSFSSLAALIVPHVPAAETGSALAFNQLLRYLGFTVGSAVSVAVFDVLGADDTAFTLAVLGMAGLCVIAAAVALLDRRTPQPG